jgi:hypothetical protein
MVAMCLIVAGMGQQCQSCPQVNRVQTCGFHVHDKGSCHLGPQVYWPMLRAFAPSPRRVAQRELFHSSASLSCSAGTGCPSRLVGLLWQELVGLAELLDGSY